jgi:hypothetical protein
MFRILQNNAVRMTGTIHLFAGCSHPPHHANSRQRFHQAKFRHRWLIAALGAFVHTASAVSRLEFPPGDLHTFHSHLSSCPLRTLASCCRWAARCAKNSASRVAMCCWRRWQPCICPLAAAAAVAARFSSFRSHCTAMVLPAGVAVADGKWTPSPATRPMADQFAGRRTGMPLRRC